MQRMGSSGGKEGFEEANSFKHLREFISFALAGVWYARPSAATSGRGTHPSKRGTHS